MHLLRMKLSKTEKKMLENMEETGKICLIGMDELRLILKETNERILFLDNKLVTDVFQEKLIKKELKELNKLKSDLEEIVSEES